MVHSNTQYWLYRTEVCVQAMKFTQYIRWLEARCCQPCSSLTFKVFLEAKGDYWKNLVVHIYNNKSKAHVNNPSPVCKICSDADTAQLISNLIGSFSTLSKNPGLLFRLLFLKNVRPMQFHGIWLSFMTSLKNWII